MFYIPILNFILLTYIVPLAKDMTKITVMLVMTKSIARVIDCPKSEETLIIIYFLKIALRICS